MIAIDMIASHRTFSFVAALVVALAIIGCSRNDPAPPLSPPNPQQKALAMSPSVSIKVGESASEFAKRYAGLVKMHQPAPGTEYYAIDWDDRPRGIVQVDHGRFSFMIDDVLGISSLLINELSNEGLSEFTIFSGITEPDLISHDEARRKFYEILQSIQQKGWKPLVERGDARISEKERLNYALGTDKYAGLDPYYLPTLEEWMRIESLTPWSFYADHVYLDLNFTREPTLTDPTKPGSYLISFDLKTEAEYFRSFVKGEDRHRWKELMPPELDRLAQQRKEKEAALEADGIKIDTSYQDPPVPELK